MSAEPLEVLRQLLERRPAQMRKAAAAIIRMRKQAGPSGFELHPNTAAELGGAMETGHLRTAPTSPASPTAGSGMLSQWMRKVFTPPMPTPNSPAMPQPKLVPPKYIAAPVEPPPKSPGLGNPITDAETDPRTAYLFGADKPTPWYQNPYLLGGGALAGAGLLAHYGRQRDEEDE